MQALTTVAQNLGVPEEVVLARICDSGSVSARIAGCGEDPAAIEACLLQCGPMLTKQVVTAAAPAAPAPTPAEGDAVWDDIMAAIKSVYANATPDTVERAIKSEDKLAAGWGQCVTEDAKREFLRCNQVDIMVAYAMSSAI